MLYPVRTKIILFTLIPVLSAYALLFGLGLTEMRQQAREDAHRWLAENASNHAYRVQLALSTLSNGAQQLANQLVSDLTGRNDQSALTRLRDRLATTPLAHSAGLQLKAGPGFAIQRGEDQATLLRSNQLSNAPQSAGWIMPPDGTPGIRFQFPLQGKSGTLGSVFLQMSPDQLHSLLQQKRASPTRVYLLDAQNRFVLHETPSMIGRPSPLSLVEPGQQASLVETFSLTAWAGDTTNHLAAVKSVDGTDWRLAVISPESSLLQAVQTSARWASSLVLISLGTIVIAVVFVSSKSLRPLEELALAAEEISNGNYQTSLPPSSEDEIGRVSRALRRTLEQQQRLEREFQASREELQARMQARTRELGEQIDRNQRQQEELRLARDQAESANRAKSEFLSNISHELRTPLNGVLGYAQILQRDTQLKPRQRENLKAIESCGQHLLTLINDVLDLSKIEAGRMQADVTAFNLPALCQEACDIVRQRARSKGLSLHMTLADDIPTAIQSDPTKLRQVLLNLLGNAIKFTEAGSVSLSVSCDELQLEFSVEDTGPGIPNDKLDVIFDAFRQADAGMAQGGTGLGLAISQRLLELLGGSPLAVDSMPDQGSRFTFSIPLQRAEKEQAELPDFAMLQDHSVLYLAEDLAPRILVVDDARENLHILHSLLGDAGFEVETCDNAKDAISRLGDQAFDLVLMDIRMPGMNGMEAARTIRQDQRLSHHKLVAVTASAFPEIRRQALNSGFDDFIAKPFHANQLFALLQKHLGVSYAKRGESDTAPAERVNDGLTDEIAAQIADILKNALEIGDMGKLANIASHFPVEQSLPRALQDEIAAMARQFDFDGLEKLAERLRK